MENIRLDLAELKYKPPDEVREALRDAAKEINEYPSGDYGELKRRFSDYIDMEENQVCFSNGLDEMIDIVTAIWGGRNFIPTPTFSQFAEASNRRNQKTTKVSMMNDGNYRLELDKINYDSDIIWLCSPNNPTSTQIDRSKVTEICQKASSKVILDECYAEFTDNSLVNLVNQFEDLIVLKSFSKSFGLAGIRLGVAISDRKNIEEIENYRQPFNVSRVAEKTGIAALNNNEKYEEIRQKMIKNGEKFSSFLEGRGFRTSKVNANFLLVEFEDMNEAEKYYKGLKKLNVVTFPGWSEEFTDLDGRFLRFTIGTESQMNKVENRFKFLEQKICCEEKN